MEGGSLNSVWILYYVSHRIKHNIVDDEGKYPINVRIVWFIREYVFSVNCKKKFDINEQEN